MRDFIKKLQGLPDQKKKIILWAIVIVLGIILFSFFIRNTTQRINKLHGNYFSSEMKTQELQQNLNSFPSQDMGKAVDEIQQLLKQSVNSVQQANQQTQNQNESKTETTK